MSCADLFRPGGERSAAPGFASVLCSELRRGPTSMPKAPNRCRRWLEEVSMIRWIKRLVCSNRAASVFLVATFWASWTGAGEFRLLSTQEPSIADIRAAIAAGELLF